MKWPERIVLGEGTPYVGRVQHRWDQRAEGVIHRVGILALGYGETPTIQPLQFPPDLLAESRNATNGFNFWWGPHAPRYRLVLEKVDDE